MSGDEEENDLYKALEEAPEDMLTYKELDRHGRRINDPSKRKSDRIEKEAKIIDRQIEKAGRLCQKQGQKILERMRLQQEQGVGSATNSDVSNNEAITLESKNIDTKRPQKTSTDRKLEFISEEDAEGINTNL